MELKANLFVAQLQDYLRLGAEARMNEPGTLKPQNWRWRLVPGQLTDALAEKIARLTNAAKRVKYKGQLRIAAAAASADSFPQFCGSEYLKCIQYSCIFRILPREKASRRMLLPNNAYQS